MEYAAVFVPTASADKSISPKYRLRLVFAPDVDLIEVKLPPFADLLLLRPVIVALYDAALQLGLQACLDENRPFIQGTRGGFHISLGYEGDVAAGRRNMLTLISSLLALFCRYPSLSYLFAGDRAGADGFHPRLDEMFSDAEQRLSTIQSLCKSLSELDVGTGSWASGIQTLLSLLRDRFGSSHFTELCLDKFWHAEPDRSHGILEIRCLEMTPRADQLFSQIQFVFYMAEIVGSQPALLSKLWQTSERSGAIDTYNPYMLEEQFRVLCKILGLTRSTNILDEMLNISNDRYPLLASWNTENFAASVRYGRPLEIADFSFLVEGETCPLFLPLAVTVFLSIRGCDPNRNLDTTKNICLRVSIDLSSQILAIREAAEYLALKTSKSLSHHIANCSAERIKSSIISMHNFDPLKHAGLTKLVDELRHIDFRFDVGGIAILGKPAIGIT